jgi:hypothetical protein
MELWWRWRGCYVHWEVNYVLILIGVADLMSPRGGEPIGSHTFEDSMSKKYVIGILCMKDYSRDLTDILV